MGDHQVVWRVAFISALVGTYSHVGLDAVMHRDMRPFWPIIYGNGFLGVISVGTLHLLCVALGLLGGSALTFMTLRNAKAYPDS